MIISRASDTVLHFTWGHVRNMPKISWTCYFYVRTADLCIFFGMIFRQQRLHKSPRISQSEVVTQAPEPVRSQWGLEIWNWYGLKRKVLRYLHGISSEAREMPLDLPGEWNWRNSRSLSLSPIVWQGIPSNRMFQQRESDDYPPVKEQFHVEIQPWIMNVE